MVLNPDVGLDFHILYFYQRVSAVITLSVTPLLRLGNTFTVSLPVVVTENCVGSEKAEVAIVRAIMGLR